MPNSQDGHIVFEFVLCVIALVSGLIIGSDCQRAVDRTSAINAGVGRWVTNPKTGETRFYYGLWDTTP